MITSHFKKFFYAFTTRSGHNDSFMDDIDVDVIECFAVELRKVWDMKKTFNLETVKSFIEMSDEIDASKFKIYIHDELLLIHNDTVAVKFYTTGVFVPEVIGERGDWFNNLKWEFIDAKPAQGGSVEIADNYIITKDGIICPDNIEEIYEVIANDKPEEAIEIFLKGWV